eukprot:3480831-Rhodomonas_salina.2
MRCVWVEANGKQCRRELWGYAGRCHRDGRSECLSIMHMLCSTTSLTEMTQDWVAGWSKSCWEEQRGSLLIDTAVGHRVEQGEHRMEATLTGEAAVVRFGARSSTCAAGCLALFFKVAA